MKVSRNVITLHMIHPRSVKLSAHRCKYDISQHCHYLCTFHD
eukprot:UN06289